MPLQFKDALSTKFLSHVKENQNNQIKSMLFIQPSYCLSGLYNLYIEMKIKG